MGIALRTFVRELGRKKIIAALLVIIGFFVGVAGAVRSASLIIAIGASLYAAVQYSRSATKRKIELIVPLLIALLLFVVALTLPHAK